jgi:hypothetical protein
MYIVWHNYKRNGEHEKETMKYKEGRWRLLAGVSINKRLTILTLHRATPHKLALASFHKLYHLKYIKIQNQHS